MWKPSTNPDFGMYHGEDADLARVLLRGKGITLTQAARLVIETLEGAHQQEPLNELPVSICRHILQLGLAAYRKERDTVTFLELAEKVMQSKENVRERSLSEMRQIFKRVARMNPSFLSTPVRRITADDCRALLNQAYDSLSMRHKALRIIHHAFAHAVKRRWCDFNPTDQVELPKVVEQHIPVLSIQQVKRLLETLLRQEHIVCAPAVGLMLWAGIRPTELMRLRWCNLNFEDRVISVPPEHSKTGGPRHVTLYPILLHWLRRTNSYFMPQAYIVPRSWIRRWRQLRKDAGLTPWCEDTLRHTFASYHAKYFCDFNQLQMEMGHSSSALLRTRYLSMQGLTRKGAKSFWEDIILHLGEEAEVGGRVEG